MDRMRPSSEQATTSRLQQCSRAWNPAIPSVLFRAGDKISGDIQCPMHLISKGEASQTRCTIQYAMVSFVNKGEVLKHDDLHERPTAWAFLCIWFSYWNF